MEDQGGEEVRVVFEWNFLQDIGFPSEDVERCLQESVEAVLATAMWDEIMVPQWINDICEKSMKALMELNRPYKFIGMFPSYFLI